ncbi:heme peroxidase-domain-containing protein [Diplogelasinospora grovesii]|uniref:Heme peroxidase-domain-containing protein n=1 Tax=Diplogelasinospora grovesii TaxID=303347 RepID=A0AAN6S305_9PEZI|nr:heme peroxidase-domain-containing protein [Diplogelasinospora grovesii]
MSSPSDRQRLLVNGDGDRQRQREAEIVKLNDALAHAQYMASFHGDALIGDKITPSGFVNNLKHTVDDIRRVFTFSNVPQIGIAIGKALSGGGLDMQAGAKLVASMANDSSLRASIIEGQVKAKYERMLHPPLTYLGDAFKYRTADGKFNSALNPHLGQAGAPYAKTVPSKTHPLGALPDPGDLFDKLMARDELRQSKSGLSSMLIYHATIIIHDIFRTNDKDKNISDTSSYLDLSPLYGFTEEMQRQVRDDKFKLGLLKPDTFAEDRLLRQPPGVCIMLVMYNRYHNYAATQLRRINENGRFSVPEKYALSKLAAAAKHLVPTGKMDKKAKDQFQELLDKYGKAWKAYEAWDDFRLEKEADEKAAKSTDKKVKAEYEKKLAQREEVHAKNEEIRAKYTKLNADYEKVEKEYKDLQTELQAMLDKAIADQVAADKVKAEDADKEGETFVPGRPQPETFYQEWEAAWNKLDDDLFNTARLITCGMYIQVSIHDYLRALMGFHAYDTNFTLDPRVNMAEHKNVSRGLGNQVTVEFNLLYRFHCAISDADEKYAEEYLRQANQATFRDPDFDPKKLTLEGFFKLMGAAKQTPTPPWKQEFGLANEEYRFQRDPVTNLFNDEKMIKALTAAMDEPISNFGPKNVPKCLKPVEILGIIQARKWEIGTLNDFREFFGMKRHQTFESITRDTDVQNSLRDLYEHPDKVELYPGVFCESDEKMNADPGPSDIDSALWAAIFSDAITLVRSDRFYTVDWNTNSLTSWGMKEVTPDNDVLKSSVFHRLLQRAFPEWFPYDSIRFFHPFYTAKKNAALAREQGYADGFSMNAVPTGFNIFGRPKDYVYEVDASDPAKPEKPVLLTTTPEIKALLADQSDKLVHPARLKLADLPSKIADVLEPRQKVSKPDTKQEEIDIDESLMTQYFVDLMRDIIRREFIVMDKDRPIYQIDITRDVAIPVITRYVADFLGFGDQVKSDRNPRARYSENEIYQHITNCQIFLSYNADETKLLKRRQAFKSSMAFLYKLTQAGNIYDANRWSLTRWTANGLGYLLGRSGKNPMRDLGFRVARHVLDQEKDAGRAAAILLLIGLDGAYNAVLAFSSVLNFFMQDLYATAAKPQGEGTSKTQKLCSWQEIQRLAFDDTEAATTRIKQLVLDAQRRSVRLPIIRKAVETRDIEDASGKRLFTVDKGRTVICDIYQAGENDRKAAVSSDEHDYLAYRSSFTEKFAAAYHPKHLAALSLTTMVKVLAQMKNLRRGHDTQGRLRKVRLDGSYEGYSNYMAPMRMIKIPCDLERCRLDLRTKLEVESLGKEEREALQKQLEGLDTIFSTEVLKPTTDTFLTPEWDEFVPFPTTWKVRFDGFGESDYGGDGLPMLKQASLPDYVPPFYQPTGPSHVGGSFAPPACICNAAGKKPTNDTKSDKETNPKDEGYYIVQHAVAGPVVGTAGCGLPGPAVANGHA